MKLEIIPTKGILYDKCENVEQLYDKYYYPLLVEFKELQKKNANLKEHYNNMFECHCNRVEVEKLQNNWNELKEYAKENLYFYSGLQGEDREEDTSIKDILNKMQELEQGKDE